MTEFWPPREASQVDYESLRAGALGPSGLPTDLAAARFLRRGLAGLVDQPVSEPVFAARLLSAAGRGWTGRVDPAGMALANAYALVLEAFEADSSAQRRERRA
jgi:hypothetical protein